MTGPALDFLLGSQNSDGGWGYRVGGMSYVEPTASVILTLGDSATRDRALDFLLGLQQKDGGWGIAAMDPESGWMTAWAIIALAKIEAARDAVRRGAAWLLATSPFHIVDEKSRQDVFRAFRIDSALRGFSWQPGDASWVHPTALGLRALVLAGKREEPRVDEGLAYLLDRAVAGGGWNVGNPWMIDKVLASTIQDSAVALIALHAANAPTDARIDLGIQFLRQALSNAKTPAELAWGISALRDWQIETASLITRLNALQNTDGSWSGNPFITAIALRAQD